MFQIPRIGEGEGSVGPETPPKGVTEVPENEDFDEDGYDCLWDGRVENSITTDVSVEAEENADLWTRSFSVITI